MASRTVAALILAAGLLIGPAASAQALQRLTVQSFNLISDPARPQVDIPFRLIVTLRVREPVTRIDNLELPVLAELELLGDERQTASGPNGTEYREIITVVARHGGAIAIGPARLQAIDARDRKPKQWETNALTLNVGGVSQQMLRNQASAIFSALFVALRALLWLLGIACVVALAVLLLRRRRPIVPVTVVSAPVPPVAPPAPQRTRRQQFEDALAVLRAERTRAAAVRVRAAVWRMVGASDGETLGDVLRRPEASDPTMRELLISLERSAFTYDDDLTAAIGDSCSALERQIGAEGSLA